MFFDDKKYKNKVDLGNKKVTSKDEFLHKMKEDKVKESNKLKVQENNKILGKFFDIAKTRLVREGEIIELGKNLKSVATLLDVKKDLNHLQKEKLAQNAFNKTVSGLSHFSKAYNIHQYSNDILNSLIEILKYLSKEVLLQIYDDNFLLFVNLYVIAIEDLFRTVKKNVLVNRDKNLSFFNMLSLFYNVDMGTIYFSLANNKAIIYFLTTILNSFNKVTDSNLQAELIKFTIGLNYYSVSKNPIHENLSFVTIRVILNNSKLLKEQDLFYKTCDLLYLLAKANDKDIVSSLNFENLLLIISEINNSLSDQYKRTIHISNFKQTYIETFTTCLQMLKDRDLSNISLGKYNIDRKTFLKTINNMLEYVMESTNYFDTDKLILLIWNAGKLIVNLYRSNYEKTDFSAVLDYIFNKIILKYNSRLIDEILKYSIVLIQGKKEVIKNYKVYKKQLEIISFAIITKIEYKENYIFVDIRGPQDINQNLPFNNLYLNHISRMLIELFTQLINKKNLEEIEKLRDNIIIKCLKALYSLDIEIEFSWNRESFWSNMELISKIYSFSKTKQIESIKIIPFVFPFVSRLTVMNSVLSEIKMSRAQDAYQYLQSSHDLNLIIGRKTMFDDTLVLYLNDRLLPYVRWHITFVNEFGMKEEGGKIF
jgi:hypothetical protein